MKGKPAKESEDLRGMREVALRNFERLRQNTREMIANLKETYQMLRESEERQSEK